MRVDCRRDAGGWIRVKREEERNGGIQLVPISFHSTKNQQEKI